MGMRLCGLTPKEHFRLHGKLPTDGQDKLIEEHEELLQLLLTAYEIAPDLEEQCYRHHESFDTPAIAKFLKIVRRLHGLV